MVPNPWSNPGFTNGYASFGASLIPTIAPLGCTFDPSTNVGCCGPGPRNPDGSCGGTIQQIYNSLPGNSNIDWATGLLSAFNNKGMPSNCCCGGQTAAGGASANTGAVTTGPGATSTSGNTAGISFFARFPWWLVLLAIILMFWKKDK